MSFSSMFCMKTVKTRLFKKYLKKNCRQVFLVSWLAKYLWKKINELYNSVSAGAHEVGKVVSLWSNFDPNLPDTWKVCKGKLHILKKVDLSTFKEIL